MNSVIKLGVTISFIIFIIAISTVLSTNLTFASEDTITFEKGYAANSEELYQMAQALVKRYAFLLELEDLGETQDGRPIYVIRMTYNIYKYDSYDYVDKTHILIDGGVHARETYNPVIVLKMIEDYVKDYYSDAYLPGQNVRELLQTSVMHFIPIVNPDGFDVAKFGLQSIQNSETRATFSKLIPNLNSNRLKGNLSGVDLNRNFKDVYFNVDESKWEDLWGSSGLYRDVAAPDESIFKGYKAASEIETQTLMAYMMQYDFRAYLTYHSMGQVIYYWIDHIGQPYFELNRKYALQIANITGYQLMVPDKYIEYGFSTDYFANNTTKPAITIETTNSFTFPTPLSHYAHEYSEHRLWEIPLAILKQTKKDGYYDFKIYVNDRYIQDAISYDYAVALAKQLNGVVHNYEGNPSLTISKKISLEFGNDYHLDFAIQSKELKIFVSLSEVFYQLGYEIHYDSELDTAIASKENREYRIALESMEIFDPEGKLMTVDQMPLMVEQRIMVPLNFATALMNLSLDEMKIKDLGENLYIDLDK
ncbi:M14 family zinc carboxypeptidase [Fusibacter bizertensis]